MMGWDGQACLCVFVLFQEGVVGDWKITFKKRRIRWIVTPKAILIV